MGSPPLETLYGADSGLGPHWHLNLDVDIDNICAVVHHIQASNRIFDTKGIALQVAAAPIIWRMSARFAGNRTWRWWYCKWILKQRSSMQRFLRRGTLSYSANLCDQFLTMSFRFAGPVLVTPFLLRSHHRMNLDESSFDWNAFGVPTSHQKVFFTPRWTLSMGINYSETLFLPETPGFWD